MIAGFGSRSTATLKLHTWLKLDGWMTVLANPAICLSAYALFTNSMFHLFFKRLSETNQEMICSVFSIAGPLSRCRAGGVAEQGNKSGSCLLNLPACVKPSSFFMPCKNCGKWDVCCHLLTLLFSLTVATLQHIWLNMQARSCNAVKCGCRFTPEYTLNWASWRFKTFMC